MTVGGQSGTKATRNPLMVSFRGRMSNHVLGLSMVIPKWFLRQAQDERNFDSGGVANLIFPALAGSHRTWVDA